MIYLFDNTKTLFGEIPEDDLLSYDQKLVLGGTITATASATYHPDIEAAHYFGSKDIDDENEFLMYRITSMTKESGKIFLTGIHLMFHELQGEVVRDKRPTVQTPAVALGSILDGSAWQVGTAQTTGTASGSYYYQSRLSALYDFAKKWNVEFKPRMTFSNGVITGRYIDLYDQIPADYGKRYEYGDKLIHVVAEQANEGIYTALIGRGKGEETESGGFGRRITFEDVEWSVANGDPVDKPLGQDYVSLPSAVATYGYREAVVEFTDTEDPALLLAQTYQELVHRSRPKVEFKSDVIETGRVELGETVSIIRDNLGIRYKTRIFELDRNFLNKKIKTFKFGDKITSTAAERIKEENEKIEEKLRENQSIMFEALERITDSYWNEDGYNYELKADNEYGLPAGYYSFDRPIDQSPTKVVYMGAGKVLIADSQDGAGEWEWRTALTPEGLVGSEIIANSITANKLASDVGQTLDLSSNESIISTVSDKTDMDGDPLFAKTSEVKQTVDTWTATFSQIGGANMITNSNNLFFTAYDGNVVTITKDVSVPEWGATDATQITIAGNSGGTSDLRAYSTMGLPHATSYYNGKPHTLSVYVKNNRPVGGSTVTIDSNRYGATTVAPQEVKRIVLSGENSLDRIPQLQIETNGPSWFVDITIWHPQFEEGYVATGWTPHPDELYAGVTRIDKDGINVSRSDSNINTQVSHEGLAVLDGESAVATFMGGTSFIPNLEATNFYSPNVTTRLSSITLTVRGSGAADGEFDNISDALDSLGNRTMLVRSSVLTINVYGTVFDEVKIDHFTGEGYILINFVSGATLIGGIDIVGCGCMVWINGTSTAYGTIKRHTGLQNPIRGKHCPNLIIVRYMNLDGAGTPAVSIISAMYGTRISVLNCNINNGKWAILGQYFSQISAVDNVGGNITDNTAYASEGSIVWLSGAVPNSTGPVSAGSGFVTEKSPVKTGSSYTPVTIVPTAQTKIFAPSQIYTVRKSDGYTASYYGQAAVQGYYTGNQFPVDGIVKFGSQVYDFFNGGTNTTVKVRFRRKNSTNGRSSAVAPRVYNIALGTFNPVLRGEWTSWVTVSSSHFTSAGVTFKLYPSTVSDYTYAWFDACQVSVTTTK